MQAEPRPDGEEWTCEGCGLEPVRRVAPGAHDRLCLECRIAWYEAEHGHDPSVCGWPKTVLRNGDGHHSDCPAHIPLGVKRA